MRARRAPELVTEPRPRVEVGQVGDPKRGGLGRGVREFRGPGGLVSAPSPQVAITDDIGAAPVRQRRSLRGDPATIAIGVLCGTLVMVSAGFAFTDPAGPFWPALVPTGFSAVFFAAGIAAWRRRPHNRVGLLMLLTGAAAWVAGLAAAPTPALQAIGTVTATIPLALTLHLLLAYPTGRVTGRLARVLVVTGYIISTVLEMPRYLVGDSPLALWTSDTARAVASVVLWAQTAIGVSCMLGAVVVVARRAIRLTTMERHLVEPMVSYRIVCSLVIAATAAIPRLTRDPALLEANSYLQVSAVAGLPVVFLIGLLFGSFGRTGKVSEMMIQVGTSTPSVEELSGAVAVALGDSDAVVVYARSDGTGFLDGAGYDVRQPDVHGVPSLEMFPVRYDGRLVGGILHRARLIADPGVLAVLAGIVAMAIDQQRLIAEQRALVADLRSREVDLQESRRRLLRAEDDERRRIARDLHDGAQQHLVALGLTSRRLSRSTTDPEAARRAEEVADGLVDLLAEFRSLIAGIMPAPLLERGFLPAVDILAERMPIPTRVVVTMAPQRLPAETESTLYFMVSEALTNVIKHANASSAEVTVEMVEPTGIAELVGTVGMVGMVGMTGGRRLVVTVVDDGRGGADPLNGTGLRGLADRIASLGGSVRVVSPSGAGCSVRAEIPCA